MGVACSQRDLREVTQGLAQVAGLSPDGRGGRAQLGLFGQLRVPACEGPPLPLPRWRGAAGDARPGAGLQRRSALSALSAAEQQTLGGNCGYRKRSSVPAFTSRLF